MLSFGPISVFRRLHCTVRVCIHAWHAACAHCMQCHVIYVMLTYLVHCHDLVMMQLNDQLKDRLQGYRKDLQSSKRTCTRRQQSYAYQHLW